MWHLKSTIVEEDVGRSLWWFVFVVGDITKGDLTQMQVKSNVFKILFWSKSLDKPRRFMGKLKDFLPSPCPCWRRIVPSPGEKSVCCERHSWIWRRTTLIIKARLSVSLTWWESRLSWQILKGRRTCCRWRMDPVVTICNTVVSASNLWRDPPTYLECRDVLKCGDEENHSIGLITDGY